MANSLKEEHREELHDLLLSIDHNTLRTRLLEMSGVHDNIAQLLYKHLVTPEQVDVISSSEDQDSALDEHSDADSEVEILDVKNNDDPAGSKRSRPINVDDLNDGASSTKRAKNSRTVTSASCTHCSALFTLENNREGDCVYHSSSLEINEETFYDNDDFEIDEATFGDHDDDAMREDWPQYFIWRCCDENGEAIGCKREKHSIVGAPTDFARLKHGGFTHGR